MRSVKYLLVLSLGAAACSEGASGDSWVLSSTGSAGMAGAAGTGGAVAVAPLPDAESDWLLLGFSDPIGIGLTLKGNPSGDAFSVTGLACYDGPVDIYTCRLAGQLACTPLSGQGRGNGLELEMSFDGGYAVSSRLWLSDDGKRMAGSMAFSSAESEPVYEPGYGWLNMSELAFNGGCSFQPRVGANLFSVLTAWESLEPCYALQGDEAVGTLRPGEVYCVRFGRALGDINYLSGALGAFHNGDFRWDASTESLHFGPVAATAPHLPVELTLRLTPEMSVIDAVVVTAEGESGTLLPTPRPLP